MTSNDNTHAEEKKAKIQAKIEQSLDRVLDDLMELMKDNVDTNLESFASYKAKTKEEVKKNITHYQQRLQRGLKVLLDELKESESDDASSHYLKA